MPTSGDSEELFPTRRFPALTSLRFFAALGVVFYHYGRELPELSWAGGLVHSGHQMVTFFFVLSGFVLTTGYPQPQKKRFWKRRFWRLAPVYLLALTLTMAAYLVAHKSISWVEVGVSGLALQSWLPGWALTLNRPGWSISVEVFFYLMFPFICRWSTASMAKFAWGYWWLSQFLVTVFVNLETFPGYPSWQYELVYYWPPTHLGAFLLGMWAAGWRRENADKEFGSLPVWFLLVGGVLYFREPLETIGGFVLPWDGALHAPLFVALILALSSPSGMRLMSLDNPVLQLLGEASYALYILQYPLAWLYELFTGFEARQSFWGFLLILTVTSILVFRILESPFRRMK